MGHEGWCWLIKTHSPVDNSVREMQPHIHLYPHILIPPPIPSQSLPRSTPTPSSPITSSSPHPSPAVTPQAYPHILITAGLWDPRVAYWEPAKLCAKLRAAKQGDNLLLMKVDMGAGHFR